MGPKKNNSECPRGLNVNATPGVEKGRRGGTHKRRLSRSADSRAGERVSSSLFRRTSWSRTLKKGSGRTIRKRLWGRTSTSGRKENGSQSRKSQLQPCPKNHKKTETCATKVKGKQVIPGNPESLSKVNQKR